MFQCSSQNGESRNQASEKERKIDKKSRKSKKSHKHHEKRHDRSTEKDKYKHVSEENSHYDNSHRYHDSKSHSDNRKEHGEKYYRYERNEKYNKSSNYYETDGRARSSRGYEFREKERERDKRRLQKSEELLENKRKSRPMSPPKVLYDQHHERYPSHDENWCSSKYTPTDSSRTQQSTRFAPSPQSDWERRATSGYNEQPSERYNRNDHR